MAPWGRPRSGAEERVELVDCGGEHLALHSWVPAESRAVVFYVHGIQSHGGWLFETGPALALLGIAVYVLDRRGSGYSQGLRGDVPSLSILLDDYLLAADAVRARHPRRPFVLLGQSLGGAIAAGLATDGRLEYDAMVLCAPALQQMRAKLSAHQRAAIRANRTLVEEPVALSDEAYTSDERFLRFMRSDARMLRRVTGRTRATLLDLEDFYMSSPGAWRAMPVAFVRPRTDSIIRLDAAREAFAALAGGEGIELQFPADDHYLEFSRCREPFRAWLAGYAASAGYGA